MLIIQYSSFMQFIVYFYASRCCLHCSQTLPEVWMFPCFNSCAQPSVRQQGHRSLLSYCYSQALSWWKVLFFNIKNKCFSLWVYTKAPSVFFENNLTHINPSFKKHLYFEKYRSCCSNPLTSAAFCKVLKHEASPCWFWALTIGLPMFRGGQIRTNGVILAETYTLLLP